MMNYLLYFFPDKNGVTPTLIRDCGLVPVVGELQCARVETMNGPGDRNGVTAIFHRGEDVRVKYDRANQVWEECAGGQYWIGYWRDQVPGPADLARAVQVDGHMVRLADEQEWRIPLVRQWQGGTELPVRFRIDADGTRLQQVSPKHQALYERGLSEWEDWYNADDSYSRSFGQLLELAEEVLAVNYHVGKWECSTLGLFESDNVRAVFRAMIDLKTVDEMVAAQKKTDLAPDTSCSSDGSEAS